ncbi:MAG TPA: tetratricopeptide repeat protein [Patescibacteria group bacterium]|nr:tetratricopeptide repeat protein [Patescibacteria group bacterium]
MNDRLRLCPEIPLSKPVRYSVSRKVSPAYLLLLLLVLAVGTASVIAWYRSDYCLESRAERGDNNALYLLGKRYFDSAMSPRDYARAARLIRQAAEHGHPAAETALGLLYENGLGSPRNYLAAVRWFYQAANQGYPVAQNELGVMYAKGRGLTRNLNTAARWFRLAAAQGSEIARRNLQLTATAKATAIPQLAVSNRKSYQRVVLQRIESDGITFSFSPRAGGFGLAKLKMENLPSDLQELCKYASHEGQPCKSAYSQVGPVSGTL